jgi:formylglycine-generating enzyme required for sulfatase activity
VRLLTADGCDLPTEAQWEWACRAGKTHRWWSGDAIESLAGVANVFDLTGKARSRWDGTPAPFEDGYFAHAPVGSFRASPFGLHDVHGNVWEWCRDRFNDYGVAPALRDGLREVRSPVDLRRLVRGGSFADGAQKARSSARWAVAPTTCLNILGVRPARPIRQ